MSALGSRALEARVERLARVRSRMEDLGVDALLLSLGADLPWLTGYLAMPLERLTMLVLPASADPVLVVPALEAPRVPDTDGLVVLRLWSEDEDPVGIVVDLIRASCGAGSNGPTLAVSDRTWAVSLLALQAGLHSARWQPASIVTSPLRAVKDDAEIDALRAAGQAADRVAASLQKGDIPLVGRTERQVSDDLSARLLAEGHDHVNFAIVGSGPNGASPHHEPGDRVIGPGELVVCDFGGSLSLDGDVGYCSDITRTVATGQPAAEVSERYEVLRAAQQAAVGGAREGTPAEEVDGIARRIIADAGWGAQFLHRTGHGIGIEEHEDPYLVAGNDQPLRSGHAFSVEPGIYESGRFGMRLEDIVVIGGDGEPEPLNRADHALVVVDA